MGSDFCEVQETPLHSFCIKVHLHMCTQLLRLVDRISSIFPDLEAARPRCSSGIQALCLLQSAMEKARMLVQNCCESSKLYLALTGDTVVSRFERTRNLLQQSLSQLQNMVPVALEFEITEILVDLRDAVFVMDSHEEEAGKALRALLQQDKINSGGNTEVKVLQFAALRLNLSSQKDFLIEKRSIRKLLNEVNEVNSKKGATLRYLLYLLKKYDKLIVKGQTTNPPTKNNESCFFVKSNSKSVTTNSNNLEYRPVSMLHSRIPPEEFKCPLSSKLMYDPVIISSGQTFERTSIQKWFDKGHDTCPRTKLKLADFSVTPNTSMKDLILRWSMEHGITVSDPRIQASSFGSLETSSNSICSIASSMKDLHLQIDISNLSLGSLDSIYSYSSDFSQAKVERGFSSLREPSDLDSYRFQFFRSIHDIKRRLLFNVSGLPWESQCRVVQDVKDYLINYNPSCASLSSENFLEPLVQFLKDAHDKHDAEAHKAGSQLLLIFLQASRRKEAPISEELYTLLVSFLGTEAADETLAIMEVLSTHASALPRFVASGALTSTIKFLDSGHNRKFEQAAIRILHNLSLSIDTCSYKLVLDWIPKLVPFLRESSITGTCLSIFENLCKFEAVRVSIAETAGCLGSIVELLETGSCEEQERAVGILLSLCSQREHYCHLVLHEGVVPFLWNVSVNGNERGKVGASELLRLLRNVRYEDEEECPRANVDAPDTHSENLKEKKSWRMSGSLGKKMKRFLRKN